MANEVVLTCAHLLIGGYDFSAQFNDLNVNVGSESLDMSTFGSDYRKHKGGVQTAGITANGFLNLGSSLVDPVIYGTVGGGEKIITAFFNGVTVGSTYAAFGFGAINVKYNLGGTFGSLLAFDIDGQSATKMVEAVVLDTKLSADWTTASTGGTVLVFCTSGDKKLYGGFHVTSLSTALCTISGIIAANSSSGYTAANPNGSTRITFSAQSCKDGTFATPVLGSALSTEQPFYRSVITLSTASAGGTARGVIYMGIE
jgi:hypothetical protein